MRDFRFGKDALGRGDRMPDFDLPTTSGGRLRSADLRAERPMLLVFGSVTCPMTAASAPSLKGLHGEFGDRVEFVTLYVREAHPGENYDQVETLEQKLDHARALQESDGLPWTVAVDDVDGSLHRALDPKPNAAYLVDADGVIAFRSLWAGDEKGLRRALRSLLRGESPRKRQSTAMLGPLAQGMGRFPEVLRRAGRRAQLDVLKAAPPIALASRLTPLFGALPARGRGAAAMASVGLLSAATFALILGWVMR